MQDGVIFSLRPRPEPITYNCNYPPDAIRKQETIFLMGFYNKGAPMKRIAAFLIIVSLRNDVENQGISK
jgi:hypothetical protein